MKLFESYIIGFLIRVYLIIPSFYILKIIYLVNQLHMINLFIYYNFYT